MTTTPPKVENREQLLAAAKEAVRVFDGKTADEVADIVRDKIGTKRAECGSPHSCAIALYVIEQAGLPETLEICVAMEDFQLYDSVYSEWLDDNFGATECPAGWWDEYRIGRVTLPGGVEEFIGRFDRGEYPDLATDESLPAVEDNEDDLLALF